MSLLNHPHGNLPAKRITKSYPPQPIFDKSAFDDTHFIKMPSDLRHYLLMSPYGFTADTLLVYLLLVDKYNVNQGYAFPSQYTLALEMGKSLRTVKRHVGVLKDIGLLEVIRRGVGKSNYYRPLLPLDREKMLDRYPKSRIRLAELEEMVAKYKEIDMLTIPKSD